MTTQQNINQAKEAYLKHKGELDACTLNKDAIGNYITNINAGVWDPANGQVPNQGPLTKDQAALLDLVIPSDYSMPTAFTMTEVWNRAAALLPKLEAECKILNDKTEDAHKILKDMEEQYQADLDRANQIAASDPAVIAAKENAAAAKVKADAELEKQKMADARAKENAKTMLMGAVILMGVMVFGVIIFKALR